jgi:hypothetical protein
MRLKKRIVEVEKEGESHGNERIPIKKLTDEPCWRRQRFGKGKRRRKSNEHKQESDIRVCRMDGTTTNTRGSDRSTYARIMCEV